MEEEEFEKVKESDANEVMKTKEKDQTFKAETKKLQYDPKRIKADGLTYQDNGVKINTGDGQVVKGVNNYP